MSRETFDQLAAEIAEAIADRPVDDGLRAHLEETFPADGETFTRMEAACRDGDAEGWLCEREAGGIRFGRAIKPGGVAGNFSIDVVRMKDVRGPHHVHPKGEIGMIMPIEGNPKFDGMPRGWYVDPPGSDHWPTVEDGEAYVLYLLPDGEIEFTGK